MSQWERSAGPPVGWAIALWCVAAAGLVGTLLFGGFAALGFSVDHQMDTRGVTTSANVTAVDGNNVTVEFSTEDERLITSSLTWWPAERPAVGELIEITYDPDGPGYVIKAGSIEDQLLATAFALVALYAAAVAVGAAVGAVLIHRVRAARRAWPENPWAAAG